MARLIVAGDIAGREGDELDPRVGCRRANGRPEAVGLDRGRPSLASGLQASAGGRGHMPEARERA
jgi:hypothetical protein